MKKFENPELNVSEFCVENVITASNSCPNQTEEEEV